MPSKSRVEFIDWARSVGHRLDGIDLELPQKDLAPLAKIVGDAQLVGLGESWHNSHEVLTVRNRLCRFLIENQGFTALLLEGSLASATQFDDYINGGPGDALHVVSSAGSGVWHNRETVRFLDWLRSHNSKAAESAKVRIFGLDIHIFFMEHAPKAGATAESVVSYLRKLEPDYVLPHRETVARIFSGFPGGDPQSYYNDLSVEDRDALRETFSDAIAMLAQNQMSYRQRTSQVEFDWAMRRAIVVLQAQRMFEAGTNSWTDSLEVRDYAMAENAQWALDRLGARTKAVVLAHNVHIGKGLWTVAGSDARIHSLGMELARWHGAKYVALATTFSQGNFMPPNQDVVETPAGNTDSIDLVLAEAGMDPLLIDIRQGQPGPTPPTWISEKQLLRVPRVLGWHTDYVPSEAFDLFVYMGSIHRDETLD